MPTNPSPASQTSVHATSPKPILILLVLATIAFITVADVASFQHGATRVASVIFVMTAIAWALDGWQPSVGRWSAIVTLVAAIVLLSRLSGYSGALALLAIPTAVAATLIRPSASALVTVGETVLLLLLWSGGTGSIDGASVVVGLAAVWSMLAVTLQTYSDVYGLLEWTMEHYEQARTLMEEVRSKRVQHKQLLDDLVRVNRQLAVTNDKLSAARLVAEDAEKTKASFVANVSHEFRAPLNMIIGVTDLLLEAPDVYDGEIPEGLVDDLRIVRRNCEHLSSMIDDVLDLSQVDAGRMALHRERVDLRDIVDGASVVARPLIDKKGVALRVDIAEDLPDVYCDRTRIRQVVVNLLSNAARLTQEGQIAVYAMVTGEHVEVSVSDTGPGIAEEDAKRIFEPFSMGPRKVRQRGSGTGLGLSISKRFVELHGGQMFLQTKLGVGSTFTFRLPVSPPLEPSVGPGRWVAEGWQWVERTSRADLPVTPSKPRYVLCDPTAELYPVFCRYFDEVEFIDARTLEQAVHEAQRSSAQVILLNVPVVDRLEQEAEAARQEIVDTPIIACSLPPRAEVALAAGALDYLLKPVRRDDMEAALRRVSSPVRRVLVVDDEVDVQRLFARMLRAYDAAIEVTTTSSGIEALELLRTEHPDLILVDLTMPDMDGWQLLARMREDDGARDIPSIIVSGQDPRERPLASKALVLTTSEGLSVTHLMRCSQALSALLSRPAQAPHRGL